MPEHWKYDMTRFSRGLAAALPTTKRDAGEFLATQARGVVRTLFAVTPPGRGGSETPGQNRKAGEAAVTGDVARVIVPVRKRPGQPAPGAGVDVVAEIEQQRSAWTGRVRKKPGRKARNAVDDRIPVSMAQYREELRRRKALVGKLAAGWAPAARRLGVPVPAWIGRHGGRGSGGQVEVVPGGLRVVVTNRTEYGGRVRGLRARVQFALDLQGKRMERAAKAYWSRRVRGSGFDVRG